MVVTRVIVTATVDYRYGMYVPYEYQLVVLVVSYDVRTLGVYSFTRDERNATTTRIARSRSTSATLSTTMACSLTTVDYRPKEKCTLDRYESPLSAMLFALCYSISLIMKT